MNLPVTPKRLRWIGCAVCALAFPLAQAAVYDFALGDIYNRSLRMNVPDSVTIVRGIIIYGNGAQGDVRSMATDPELVALATSLECAVMGTANWGYFSDTIPPTELSWFEYGLQRFAAMSGHPEIVNAPWMPSGLSNGGNMSYELNAQRSAKVITFMTNKGGYYSHLRPDVSALFTPGVLIAGQLDDELHHTVIQDLFTGNRPRGALWVAMEEEGAGHITGNARELFFPYLEAMFRARFPVGASPMAGLVPLLAVNEADGWLTDPDSYKNGFADIAPYAAYVKDKTVAGWLPNRRLAYIFRAFASYNKPSAQATISPGTGPVDWDTTLTYAIGELGEAWTSVDFFEGDVFLKHVTPADGAPLSVATMAPAPGYSVFHAVVTLADGTQRTTMPRRVFVRAGMPPSGPSVRTFAPPAATSVGGTVIFSPSVSGYPGPSLQWSRNGVDLPEATNATLVLSNVQPADTGLYTLTAVNVAGRVMGDPAILGLQATSKVGGAGAELQPVDIHHANGNVFDQVLLTGTAATITADPGQITRTSFVDLDDDIVQVEFGGAGTLSLVLDNPSGPAAPVNYNQPGVVYMKGNAGIVITGANETTNVSIFTVGRATAFDPTGAYDFIQTITTTNNPANNGSSLFVGHTATAYDGVAGIAFIAITSTNGKFGGLRASDANCIAMKGITGIYAPGVQFTGPVFISDINASGSAAPVFIIGSSPDTRITGGDLQQANGQPVKVSGLTQLKFTDGTKSSGAILPAQTNKAVLQQNGVDVTAQIVVNAPGEMLPPLPSAGLSSEL
jgi:hypothetical protein